MTKASNHCGQALYLTRPGDTCSTAYCMEPKHHAGPCQSEKVLGTWDGEVKVILTWFPKHREMPGFGKHVSSGGKP